jgi:hypothetical protein
VALFGRMVLCYSTIVAVDEGGRICQCRYRSYIVEVGIRCPPEYKLKVANKWALCGVEKILRFRMGFCKYNMGLNVCAAALCEAVCDCKKVWFKCRLTSPVR